MLHTFKNLLRDREMNKDSKVFSAVIDFARKFPEQLPEEERENLRQLICKTFRMRLEELDAELSIGTTFKTRQVLSAASDLERELDELLPSDGFLRRYVEYTAHSEAPLAYHVYSALCAVGSVLNRRVHLDMGYYRLFPTLGVIILGPSGVKKTSAANIAVDLLQSLGVVKIYSEKLTPEALIEAMKGDNATGLVYAPEMTVFLNKQKYNEGLVQLITRFMDCPDVWESGTIGRGKSEIRNIALSSLMCNTLDWFIKSTPEDLFGGGFIARNILVVQESSPRCEPIPRPGDPDLRERLVYELAYIHKIEGEMFLTKPAHTEYIRWYSNDHVEEARNPEHELLSTYYNRKPDHIKRVAMVLHVSRCGDLHICLDCFTDAVNLLNWTEKFLPGMLRQMFKSSTGVEQDQVLRTIANVGKIKHTDLLRKLSYRMKAQEVKSIIQSLKEQNRVTEHNDNLSGHYYQIEEER